MAKLVDLTGATVVWNDTISTITPNGNNLIEEEIGYSEVYYLNYNTPDVPAFGNCDRIEFGVEMDDWRMNCMYLVKVGESYGLWVAYSSYTSSPLTYHYENHQKITITGGTDATNPKLISYVQANATIEGGVWEEDGVPLVLSDGATLTTSDGKTFLVVPIEVEEPEDPSSPNVTDLTNTKWQFMYELASNTENITINVDFTSNGTVYNKIMFEPGTGMMFFNDSGNYTVYAITDGVGSWVDEAYRKIHITGGADVTSETAIGYLQGIATRQVISTIVKKFLIKNPVAVVVAEEEESPSVPTDLTGYTVSGMPGGGSN